MGTARAAAPSSLHFIQQLSLTKILNGDLSLYISARYCDTIASIFSTQTVQFILPEQCSIKWP